MSICNVFLLFNRRKSKLKSNFKIVSSCLKFKHFAFVFRVENVRRYQQHYQELSQQRNLYSPSDTPHWTQRLPSSYQHDQTTQQFLDFQKQQEQERNFRENVASLTQQVEVFFISKKSKTKSFISICFCFLSRKLVRCLNKRRGLPEQIHRLR